MNKLLSTALLTVPLFTGSAICADKELFECEKFGQGLSYFKVCASNSGNVTLFESPQGQEHIRTVKPGQPDRGPLEGFLVCRQGASAGAYDIYYDAGDYPARNFDSGWAPPHLIQTPSGGDYKFHVIISRMSTDGVFELKQTFRAKTWVSRDIIISMTLWNRSNKLQRDVRLGRLVDFDIDSTGEPERAFSTKNSILEFDSGPPNGGTRGAVSLTAYVDWIPSEFSWTPLPSPDLEGLCSSANGWGGQANTDKLNAAMYRLGDLGPGKSKIVHFIYRSF